MGVTARQPSSGKRHIIGRYRLPGEGRVLVGCRIDGVVHVYDHPDREVGRRYFVESGFASKSELAILLADYRRQAARLGVCPMSREAIERSFAHPVRSRQ